MADLDPLIRIKKHELEEKQRILAKLYSEVERLQTIKSGLLDRIESEKNTTDEGMDIHMIQDFLNYLRRSREEIQIIDKQTALIERRITYAIDEMREAFGDLKKIEITRDRRLEELEKENKRREDALFSEIALDIHQRKQ